MYMASDAVLHHPQLVAAILESLGCENALARACAVSLFWKQEASANSLWRPLCLRRFPQLAGLLAPTADFQKLFAGQARAQSRPFRTPAMPALPPDGLSFCVHIERETRFNRRRSYKTVASATLRASANLREDDTSFSWPIKLRKSALTPCQNLEHILEFCDSDALAAEIEEHCSWRASISVHRARDGKFCSLLVRCAPPRARASATCRTDCAAARTGRQPLLDMASGEDDGLEESLLPGGSDGSWAYESVVFEPFECEDLNLRIVARLQPHWGVIGGPPRDVEESDETPELLWSLGLAFTRKGDDLTYDDEEDEMVPNPALRKVLKASTCLSELARLDWT